MARPLKIKIVLAPDSFKGSLSAVEAARAMERGIHSVSPGWRCEKIPLADGGEGTVRALLEANGGILKKTRVSGPKGSMIEAEWGWLPDQKTAVLEMAQASGLVLVPEKERNPLLTSTYGTGQMMLQALSHGCRAMIIGVGGSATNDLGSGMAQALGIRFYDDLDREIEEPMNGTLLSRVRRIDYSGLPPALSQCDIRVAVDVDNPLLGPGGASYTYGPQKGASTEICEQLESNMAHLAALLASDHRDIRDLPGAGAAGGLGGGLVAFAGAELASGASIVLDAVRFEERIASAQFIFTGEGKLDRQTARGKTIAAVCAAAARAGVPVVALVGQLDAAASVLADIGVRAAFSICRGPMQAQLALRKAGSLLTAISAQVTSLIVLSGEVCETTEQGKILPFESS